MTLNINEPITSDLFDKIVGHYNNLREGEPLHIYLNSPGGDADVMEAIISFINLNAERIALFAYGQIASAAFIIFYRAKCYREILPRTTAMAHLYTHYPRLTGDSGNWKNKPESKFVMDNIKNVKREVMDMYEDIGLSEDELARIDAAEDVYITNKRMQQLLKRQQP